MGWGICQQLKINTEKTTKKIVRVTKLPVRTSTIEAGSSCELWPTTAGLKKLSE